MITREKASVRHGGVRIDYTIVRNTRRRKSTSIVLDPREGVLVRAPSSTTSATAAAVVRQHAAWILKNASADVLHPQVRRFESPETLPYLGQDVPLVSEPGVHPRISVRIEDGVFRVGVPDGLPDDARIEGVRAAFERWYRLTAEAMLHPMVKRWQDAVGGGTPSHIQVRKQETRWGSCSGTRVLRFSWRLAMVESHLIEYVVVHELAHLLEMNHSPRFWAHVQRVMGDYRERREQLNAAGARAWL